MPEQKLLFVGQYPRGQIKIIVAPNWACAFVALEKLTGYLLNESHPVGKSKAKFFRGHGFDETNLDEFADGLVVLAQTNAVVKTEETPFGVKYIVDGELTAPNGRVLRLRTAWNLDPGEECPRFVTAYPA